VAKLCSSNGIQLNVAVQCCDGILQWPVLLVLYVAVASMLSLSGLIVMLCQAAAMCTKDVGYGS
jgi:hypothetical protein